MSLVLDIGGRDLVFDGDERGRLRVAIDGTTRELTLAQCSELVALARAALRAGQQELEFGDAERPAPRAEPVPDVAAPAPSRPAPSRPAPSVEDLEKAVRELKDAARGQRRLAF